MSAPQFPGRVSAPQPFPITPRGSQPPRLAPPTGGASPVSGVAGTQQQTQTQQKSSAAFRSKSPGGSQRGGAGAEATSTALVSGFASKAASQIGSNASRMSGSAVQNFMGGAQPSTDGSGGRLTDKRIGEIAHAYAGDGVDLVKGIEKNILAGNDPLAGITTRMDPSAIDKIVKRIVTDHQTPKHLTFDAPSPSAFSPSSAALASAERRRASFELDTSTPALKRATDFLELSSEPGIFGAGLNAGEYGLIGASSGINCHAYALNGDHTAPRSVDDLRTRSDGRLMAVCIEGGEVLHTAFLNKSGMWEQALKDDMGGGHTAILQTNADVLRGMYKNGVVLLDTEGTITQTAWDKAVTKTQPKE